MQKAMIAVALLLSAAQLSAQQAAMLVYQVWEKGIEPYISRILVTPDHLRIDEGATSDGYTLFDRHQEIIYNISLEDQSVLVMDVTDVAPDENGNLILEDEVVDDEQAPKVAGHTPKNVRLLANGELCSELVVIDGVMEDALDALSELKQVLARIQVKSIDAMPLGSNTPCDLASSIYAPDRSLRFGLPLQERSGGRSQSLVDFSDAHEVEDSLFEIPESFVRQSMFAPGAI